MSFPRHIKLVTARRTRLGTVSSARSDRVPVAAKGRVFTTVAWHQETWPQWWEGAVSSARSRDMRPARPPSRIAAGGAHRAQGAAAVQCLALFHDTTMVTPGQVRVLSDKFFLANSCMRVSLRTCVRCLQCGGCHRSLWTDMFEPSNIVDKVASSCTELMEHAQVVQVAAGAHIVPQQMVLVRGLAKPSVLVPALVVA